ncbi:cytidylyltransferase domain-containing protein [Planctomycetota bacterium]
MNAAIVFARGSENGKRNINMYLVDEYPLVYHCICAAINAKGIDRVFVSTDNKEIMQIADGLSCELVERPSKSRNKFQSIGEVIVFTVKKILKKHSECNNFVFLPGNSVMVTPYLIERSLEILEGDKSIQSAITVWKSRHDHPLYALVSNNNKLKPLFENYTGGDVYFYDGNICIIRKGVIDNQCFNEQRWWMGLPNCRLLVRPWSTGRDVHDSYDLGLARWWLENSPIDVISEVVCK